MATALHMWTRMAATCTADWATWVAMWTSIRTNYTQVVKLFIYPWIGRMSDRLGRKKLLMLALFMSAINTILFSMAFCDFW